MMCVFCCLYVIMTKAKMFKFEAMYQTVDSIMSMTGLLLNPDILNNNIVFSKFIGKRVFEE